MLHLESTLVLFHYYKASATTGFKIHFIYNGKKNKKTITTQTKTYALYLCVQWSSLVWTHLSPEWQPGLQTRWSDGSHWGQVGSSFPSPRPACAAGPTQSAGSRWMVAEPHEPCSARGDHSPVTEEDKQIVLQHSSQQPHPCLIPLYLRDSQTFLVCDPLFTTISAIHFSCSLETSTLWGLGSILSRLIII